MKSLDDRAVEMAEDTSSAWPRPVDLKALALTNPEPPKFIIDDWLPCGYATLLAGHGGVGKSAAALRLAVSIALGRDWYGLEADQRRVLYLSCEDRESVLHWRLHRLCAALDISLADLADRLHLLDLVGHDAVLWHPDPRTGYALTVAHGYLQQAIEATGAEVVVVDGISDTFGGGENVRSDVKQFVNSLVSLIPLNGAVLLVGHVAKPASSGLSSEGYSGSTGWHNSVRARWYLYPEIERGDEGTTATGDLLLDLQKSNLGRTDQSIRLRWDQDTHTLAGEIVGQSHFDRKQRDRDEQDGIMAALRSVIESGDYCPAAAQGPRTAHHVLSACPDLPDSLRGKPNRKRFWRHIEALRRIRSITEGVYRRANRTTVATLEPQGIDDTGTCTDAHNTNSGNGALCVQGATAPMHSIRQGVIGGARAHTPCVRCNGEGCEYCDEATQVEGV